MVTGSDAEFFTAFQSCALASLSHEQHLRLAWIVLQDRALLPAIDELRRGFQTFAQAKGKPEIYHETITWAFTALIHERIVRGRGGADWREFIALNPDLNRGLAALDDYYEPATLKSQLARRTFLPPDRVASKDLTRAAES